MRLINAQVGMAEVPLKKIRELPLNVRFILSNIQKLPTRFGTASIAYLEHPTDGSGGFKTFLPSRCLALFPNDDAIREFLANVNRLEIIEHTPHNSVNLRFSQAAENEVNPLEIDEDELLADDDLRK